MTSNLIGNLLMKFFYLSCSIFIFSSTAKSETIQLSCQGTEQSWNSFEGFGDTKNISRSYVIVNKKIGLMDCTVWTDRNIYCSGGVTSTHAETSFVGGTNVSVQFDRISGSVHEVTEHKSLIYVDQANPNPYSIDRTVKKYVPTTTKIEFNGTCIKSAKKF